jgi:Zn-dependent peptidase ImmA (M78 family)/DNA-binding XRE family transcriptional regulator
MSANFGERLVSARKMAGLSLAALADKTGNVVTRQAINKYEKGKMKPSSDALIALSRALGVKPDYFFRESNVSMVDMQFRKKSLLGAKESESIKHRTLEFLERYIEIETRLQDRAVFENPIATSLREIGNFAGIESAAADLRKRWKLGEAPIFDLVELLEDHGIRIFEIRTSDRFHGISAQAGDIPVIAVNLNDDSVRRRFTMAHELGHILLGFEEKEDSKQREKLCHAFAGALLLPKAVILSELGGKRRTKISVLELVKLKEIYGISIQAIMMRAHLLGIVSDATYKKFWAMVNAKGWKRKEPGEYPGMERANRFEQLVHRAAAEELITLSKAAELLNLPLSAFREKFLVAA